MTPTHSDPLLRQVEHLLAGHALAGWSDCRLLEQFVRCRDEAAFAVLLARHGPMVLRVCRSILPEAHDAEDAFQATFLVLACGAARVRDQASVGGFLHGTACRVAARARAREARRRLHQREAARMRTEQGEEGRNPGSLEAALHEELARLPDRYRQVLVLCYLEGKPHRQVAMELGWPPGSVSRRLKRACELLRERLTARGLALIGSSLGTVPAALAQATTRAVREWVVGSTLVGGSSAPAAVLAREVLRTMSAFKRGGLAALVVLLGIAAGGAALFAGGDPPPVERKTAPAAPPQPVANDAVPEVGLDRHGDPLPVEAAARLGTVRLRPGTHVLGLAFTRDGRALATVGNDGTLRLWELPSGRELARLPKQQVSYNAIAFTADGKAMAAVSDDGVIVVHDLAPAQPRDQRPAALGKERLRIKPEQVITCFLAFLPNGNLLAGNHTGTVCVWDADSKEVRSFGAAIEVPVYALSPDGKTLAHAGRGGAVVLWDVDEGAERGKLAGHLNVSSLAFAPDGKTLAVGDETNTIRLWDLKASQVAAKLVGEKAATQTRGVGDAITSLAFAPDGKTLVSVGDYGDGTIRVWDMEGRKERRRIQSQFGDTRLLALSPDGKTVAVTGMSGIVRLWDVATGKEADGDLGSQGAVYAVAVSPDSRQVATAGCDGVVRLWDRATAKELGSFRPHVRQIFALAFSPDGKRLLSSGAYEPARLWDLSERKEVRAFAGSMGAVRGVNNLSLSPDGTRVALTTNSEEVELVDVATGKVERTVAKGMIDRVAFSPDGKRLAGGGFDKMIHVWDLETGKEVWSAAHPVSTASVAFSADGRLVAVGAYSSVIFLYDAATGKEVGRLPGQDQTTRAVAISPDGRLVAASGDTGLVALYEVATGQLVRRLQGHGAHVWSLAFAPDGRSLVSGSFDGTALVWDLTGRELAKKRRGPLTDAELESSWAALGGARAEDAYQALLSLAGAPGQAVPLLRARLAGVAAPDAKVLAKWLADLDDDQFEVRERATRALIRLGKTIEEDLKRARAATESVEVRRRLGQVLDKLAEGANETWRLRRAVAVLELASTAEARDLLEHLAKKGPGEEARRQAAAALERMAKRP
jgi:RNA polymerase sigma factor (sigma-70 family)